MTAQVNREVLPQENQHASTMDTYLRNFTTMNLPLFFGSKVVEEPQVLHDEFYNILFSMGGEYY